MEGGKAEAPDGRYEPSNEEILARIRPLELLQEQERIQANKRTLGVVGGLVLVVIILVVSLLATKGSPEDSLGGGILNGEIFRRTDDGRDYRGGVILQSSGEAYMVVRTNITRAGQGTVQLKRVTGWESGDPDHLSIEQHTYTRYRVPSSMPDPRTELPRPGLYVTEYGEYDDSTGLIAVSYNSSHMMGVKMTGNQFVPAGEVTFLISLEEGLTVRMQHASRGFKNARWVEEGYQLDSSLLGSWHFKIENTEHRNWDCDFYHISKLKPLMLH